MESVPEGMMVPQCRICFEEDSTPTDELIAPCRCAGTQKHIHRRCLDEWRAQDRVPNAFSHCPTCKFQYITAIDETANKLRNLRLYLFVTRDTLGLFLLVQAVIALFAFVLHKADVNEEIVKLYKPWEEWAKHMSQERLAIGPYYVTSVILLLGLTGLCVSVAYCCFGKTPFRRDEGATRRTRRRRRTRNCGNDCNNCSCPDCYIYSCDVPCDVPSVYPCSDSGCHCNGDGCGGVSCDGDAGAVILGVLVLVSVVLFVVGLLYAVFMITVIIQRVVQRHVRLIYLRGESRVHVVVDLADKPELLATLTSSLPPVGFTIAPAEQYVASSSFTEATTGPKSSLISRDSSP